MELGQHQAFYLTQNCYVPRLHVFQQVEINGQQIRRYFFTKAFQNCTVNLNHSPRHLSLYVSLQGNFHPLHSACVRALWKRSPSKNNYVVGFNLEYR